MLGESMDARPALGGRVTDEHKVNSGLLRCPRCMSRLVSRCGELVAREGQEACLLVPKRPSEGAAAAVEEVEPVDGETAPTPAEEDTAWEWTESRYDWWWSVGGMDDVDNLGLSKLVTSPRGRMKLAMCVECNYGPVGYQLEDEAKIWLVCELLHQQDASLADDSSDFAAPAEMDMGMLQSMIASGMAIVQYHVTFDAQRLGMCLADAADGQGVEVVAFTETDGQLGPAELSGKVAVGDKVARINGKSTSGLDYGAVLDMVIAEPRPIKIHFARRGAPASSEDASSGRIAHFEWKAGAAPAEPEAEPAGVAGAADPTAGPSS